jgi:hypothetical protein
MPGDKVGQDAQRTATGITSVPYNYTEGYFQSAAGLGVVGTTVNTGWGSPWSGGFGSNVGFQFRCTIPVVNVGGVGDSIMEGAFAGTGSGGGDYRVPYFQTAVQQARTLARPLFPITLGYSSQPSTVSAELANRFMDQVLVPGIVVLQPSRNGAWSNANWLSLEAIGTRVLNAGGYVVYLTPLPDTSAAANAAAWDACRANVLAKVGQPRTFVCDPAATIGQGVNDRDPDPAFYNADNIHPNATGHSAIRGLLVTQLTSCMNAIFP